MINSKPKNKKFTSSFRNNTKTKNNNTNKKINKTMTENNLNTKNINNNRNNRRNIRLPTWHFPYKNRLANTKPKNLKEESKTDINQINHIQPVSIYGNYGPNNTFYYSNTFSDYYKEDLKSFAKKMPILKAKVKTNPKRLKKEIKKEKNESYIKEQIIKSQ